MKIRYTNTMEDLIAFNCYHNSHSPTKRRMNKKLRGMLFVASLVLLALATVDMLVVPDNGLLFGACLLLSLIGLLLAWQMPRIMNALIAFEARRVYREGQNKNVLCAHELELTADCLVERTPVSESTNALGSLEKVVITGPYAFIYQSALNAKVIPRHSVSEGDYDAFVEAVRQRLPTNIPTMIHNKHWKIALICVLCLLVGGAVAGLGIFSWWVWPHLPPNVQRRRVAAIARFEAMGGKVDTYTREGDVCGYGIDLSKTNVSDDDLWALDDFEGTIRLNLAATAITDKGVHILPRLSGGRDWWDLDLSRTLITDDAIRNIEQLSPGSLSLSHTKITDAELHRLRSLTFLTRIDLSATQAGDEGVCQIAALFGTQSTSWLHELDLSESAVTDDGLAHLQGLTLASLNLSKTRVSDIGLARLEKAGRISTLYLADTRITDKGAESFPKIKSLGTLVISRTAISDAGLAHIATMEHLGYLDVTGTRVTKAGLEDLRKALPKIQRVDGP